MQMQIISSNLYAQKQGLKGEKLARNTVAGSPKE
jgi:hypothetical protein